MRRQHALAILAGASLLVTSMGAVRSSMARPSSDFSGTLTVYDWGALANFATGNVRATRKIKLPGERPQSR